jgi:hypothetical protein
MSGFTRSSIYYISRLRVKHGWSYISTPPRCVHDIDRDVITFLTPSYSQVSPVDIATGYGLDGPVIEFRWTRFSAPVQTGCEVHRASYTMGTGSLSRG